ncbi:MAG: hypothetical protein GY795_18005 [Desulfobacterales bacterium]|nr:hypothetical protein [Desulfobacterales bacterium]
MNTDSAGENNLCISVFIRVPTESCTSRDPMLRRYIEYNCCLEIEKLSPAEAAKDWHNEYSAASGTDEQAISPKRRPLK